MNLILNLLKAEDDIVNFVALTNFSRLSRLQPQTKYLEKKEKSSKTGKEKKSLVFILLR